MKLSESSRLFIRNVYKLIRETKRTMHELEKFTRVSPGYYSRLKGTEKEPKLEVVVSTAKFFGVSVDYMLEYHRDKCDNCYNDMKESTYFSYQGKILCCKDCLVEYLGSIGVIKIKEYTEEE